MALLNRVPWHFVDEDDYSITSYERVQELIGKGFLFEACAVQSLVLESMLFHLILLKSIEKTPSEAEQIKRGVTKKPMGVLINICRKHKLFDSQFIQCLDDYREKRNLLVHRHLQYKMKFDYKPFIEESNALIEKFSEKIRLLVGKRLSEMGHPDAKKWLS